MHLKSLTLRGFKSFAEKTVLKFEPGVTAIVGPNGSGKSNVTDGVLWVLGEQSPRSLRGGSMEDVIFSGSATRQALGLAEVILTLDNSDASLPIEFSDVTIGRRVYRTGESEYFINSSSCRLLDIQELLSGSGLGRGMYSILGQGRIEEVLSARPEERRVFIEEAAGVLKHKRRRDRAVKRLASMDANLVRIKDILNEVNRQLAPVKRQAELAKAHAELFEKLRKYELSLAVVDLEELQAKWASVEAEEAEIQAKISLLESELAKVESEIDAAELAIEAAGDRADDLAEKRRRIQSVEDRLQACASLVAEKARNAVERMASLSTDSYRVANRRLVVEKNIQQTERELQQVNTAVEKGQERVTAAEERLDQASERSSNIAASMKALEEALTSDERAVGNYETAVAKLDLAIKTGQAQLAMLNEQKVSIQARLKDLEEHGAATSGEKDATHAVVVELESKLANTESGRNRISSELANAREAATSAEMDAEAARARLRAFEETVEVDPDAAKALETAGEAVIALFGEKIAVPAEHERAIEAALGRDYFCLVVKDTAALKRLAESGSENLSVLPVDRAKEWCGEVEGLAKASSVVEYPDELKQVVDVLLGDVFVAPSLEAALSMGPSEGTIVTLGGEIVHRSGKVTLAKRREAVGQLARRREIRELGKAIKELEKNVKRSNGRVEELSAAAAEFEKKKLVLSRDLESKRVELKSLEERLGAFEEQSDSVRLELKTIEERVAAYGARLEEEDGKLAENRLLLEERRVALSNRRIEIAEARQAREDSLKLEADASVEVNRVRMELDALLGRLKGIDRTYEEYRRELSELEATVDSDEAVAQRLSRVRDRSSPMISSLEALAVFAAGVAKRMDEVLAGGEDSLMGFKQALQSNREEGSGLRAKLEADRERLHAVEIVKAQLEMEVTSAVSRIVDELDVPLEKALAIEPEEDRTEMEDKAARLRRRIASIGPVNPMAIEEYQELEERAALFAKQIEDITESRKALNKVVKAIDRKIKERFIEAFDEINGHFTEIFGYLFPGGHAELVLTEPDDPDISGIDISAQPSGKKLQLLSLLSGGEKSLVSLAFLFALYLEKPCPFYILDEAEAALDDINLSRLIKLLGEMKRETQFLVITHQRRTMETADALYGVSMQADGVSKLISQKFAEVAEVV